MLTEKLLVYSYEVAILHSAIFNLQDGNFMVQLNERLKNSLLRMCLYKQR